MKLIPKFKLRTAQEKHSKTMADGRYTPELPNITKFVTTAVIHRYNQMFTAFGIHSITAGVYGYKESDIIQVECTIADDQTIPTSKSETQDKNPDYWGWLYEGKLSMIQPKRFMLNMCFPCGIEAAEEARDGKAYRLNIKQI